MSEIPSVQVGARPLLLIITGAGASADVNAAGYQNYDHRPPLASELFSRGAFQNESLSAYPALSGITHRLTHIARGVTVEQELDKLNDRALSGYITAAREV